MVNGRVPVNRGSVFTGSGKRRFESSVYRLEDPLFTGSSVYRIWNNLDVRQPRDPEQTWMAWSLPWPQEMCDFQSRPTSVWLEPKKGRFPKENPEKSGLGVWGGLGGHFYCKFWKKETPESSVELFRFIFDWQLFGFALRQPENPSFSWFFGPSGRVYGAQTKLYWVLGTPNDSK